MSKVWRSDPWNYVDFVTLSVIWAVLIWSMVDEDSNLDSSIPYRDLW